MKQMKKIISMVLVICMMVSVLPLNARASVTELEGWISFDDQELRIISEDISKEMITSYALDSNGNPTLKDDNEEKWIDRLEEMPTYAYNFYEGLAEYTDGDGDKDTFINPTEAFDYYGDGSLYVNVVEDTATQRVEFTYPEDATEEEIYDIALQTYDNAINHVLEETYSYILAVYCAFDRDYPEVFWLSGECPFGIVPYKHQYTVDPNNVGTGYVEYAAELCFIILDKENKMDIRSTAYRDYTKIYDMIDNRGEWIDQILADAPDNTEGKVRYFNEWLTKNNCYNTNDALSQIPSDSLECISALEGREGAEGPICEGYARAFNVLCNESGIPCVLVSGKSFGENHMWNYVQMDNGKWYAVDVTWNDPWISDDAGKESGSESEDYLLVGRETYIEEDEMTFGESHIVENLVAEGGVAFTNGPILEKEAYVLCEHPELTLIEAVDPTCTEAGMKSYYECECGAMFEDEEGTIAIDNVESLVIPANGHDYKTATAEPTCTEEGYTLHTCSVCNDSFIDNYVDPTGHTFSEWSETKAPTCMEKGEETRSCACGEVQTRELEVLDHLYNSEPEFIWADDSRTCKAVFECAYECGVDFETDCTMTAESTDATCTVAGTVKYTATCVMGDETYSESHSVTNATLDHEYEPVFDWSDDKTMCVATFQCVRCEKYDEIKCNVTVETVEKGIEYTASCTFDGKEYKDTILEIILPFTDVKDTSWYYEAVKYVYENDIMNGLTETTFGPNETLDRAMFATILYRLSGSPEVEFKEIFTDVKDGRYYSDAVIWAYENEIVTGYGNDTFGPADKITREQMVVMMYRYAKLMEYDLGEMAEYDHFPDADKVSNFAKEAMKWAIGNEIIKGKASGDELLLDPQGNALRAECAAIIMRFAQ